MTESVNTPWALTPEQTLDAAATPRDGLDPAAAALRLADHGRNVLKAADREPWYLILLQQFANPLVYMLIGAAGVKAYFKGVTDAVVIGSVLLFMAIVGFAQEMKAKKAMAALLSLSAPRAKVRRSGTMQLVDATELAIGDLLILDAGDRVGADARLIEAVNLRINESTFTGESLPVEKDVRVLPLDAPIHDRRNMVFMGTTVTRGRAVAVVTATGMRTEIGRIAEAVASAGKDKTPLQQSIEKLGHALIWVVLGACAMLAVAALLRGMGWVDIMLLAVAAAVSGIPEGLPAAVTVVLSICVNSMARRNVLIRKLAAVETLGTATVICSDKTGTLTLNQMTVRGIWTGGRHLTVTGSGYEPLGEFLHDNTRVEPAGDDALLQTLRGASLCNDAILSTTDTGHQILGDPTEGTLLAAAGKAGLDKEELEATHPRLGEIPFESEQQFMATLHAEDGQRVAYVKGSLERLLPMCARLRTFDGDREMDEAARQEVTDANEFLAAQAFRVLAIAVAPYPVTLGRLEASHLQGRLVLLGLVGMLDPPRDEARSAVQACKQAGIRVAMITGDNPKTATAIAAALGICEAGEKATIGREIEAMNDEQLLATSRVQNVYARIEPLHKLRIVQAFKRDGHVAAMTGDGVNDAPALEAAGIGIAMGVTGTDVAKEAADMVLADDNFASIVAAVEEGRVVFNRLRNVTFFLLMTCTGELATLFLSVALYGESPLEPIQILWINLVTGALVAIPLGLEPGNGDELSQPPRDSRVGLLYPGMLIRIAFTGLFMALLVTWIFHHAPLPDVPDEATAHVLRQTIAFTGIVVFEWFFAFQARSAEKGVLRLGLFRNRSLFLSMSVGLGLQMLLVYLPFANRLFHIRPLPFVDWGWVVLPAVVVVTIEALRKRVAPHLFAAGQWKPLRMREVFGKSDLN